MAAVTLMRTAPSAAIIAARPIALAVTAASISPVASPVSAAAATAACGRLHARAEIAANARGAKFLRLDVADCFAWQRRNDVGAFGRNARLGGLRHCGI